MDGWMKGRREGEVSAASLLPVDLSQCSQELTADLWSVAAVSVHTVPGSEPFTSVAAVGLPPQLCVCVWLSACLSVCSVSQPPVTRSDFTWRWTSPLAEPTPFPASSFLLAAEGHRLSFFGVVVATKLNSQMKWWSLFYGGVLWSVKREGLSRLWHCYSLWAILLAFSEEWHFTYLEILYILQWTHRKNICIVPLVEVLLLCIPPFIWSVPFFSPSPAFMCHIEPEVCRFFLVLNPPPNDLTDKHIQPQRRKQSDLLLSEILFSVDTESQLCPHVSALFGGRTQTSKAADKPASKQLFISVWERTQTQSYVEFNATTVSRSPDGITAAGFGNPVQNMMSSL